jgi:hypothetical protein
MVEEQVNGKTPLEVLAGLLASRWIEGDKYDVHTAMNQIDEIHAGLLAGLTAGIIEQIDQGEPYRSFVREVIVPLTETA